MRQGSLTSRYVAPVVSVAVMLVIWQLVVSFGLLNSFLFPPPSEIFTAALSLAQDGQLQADIVASLTRVAEGYALGATLGVLIGAAMGTYVRFREAADPVVEFLRQIPGVAWIPFAIIAFGLTGNAAIFIVTYAVIWPVLVNSRDGVKLVDPKLKMAAKCLGVNEGSMLYKVNLPAAFPRIYTGLWISIGIAFRAIVAAELAIAVTGVGSGIGYMMFYYYNTFVRTDVLFLGMALLAILGFLSQKGLELATRSSLKWLPRR